MSRVSSTARSVSASRRRRSKARQTTRWFASSPRSLAWPGVTSGSSPARRGGRSWSWSTGWTRNGSGSAGRTCGS